MISVAGGIRKAGRMIVSWVLGLASADWARSLSVVVVGRAVQPSEVRPDRTMSIAEVSVSRSIATRPPTGASPEIHQVVVRAAPDEDEGQGERGESVVGDHGAGARTVQRWTVA